MIMAENKVENLSRFAVNLNERAAQGKLDPVIGRDEEIRRVFVESLKEHGEYLYNNYPFLFVSFVKTDFDIHIID